MSSSIFVTGASGFIGRHLLRSMDMSRYAHVYCLTRDQKNFMRLFHGNGKVVPVEAGIHEKQVYLPYLSECETVIHMAAATGKAISKETYFQVNEIGTEELAQSSKAAGVEKILYLSTIAVSYPDKRFYYYAQSKEKGEGAIRRSGLAFTILRPTIVVGEDSRTWINLLRMVKAPFLPIFDEGEALIQPIYIEDLVHYIRQVIENCIFNNSTYELGGCEVLRFKDFMVRAFQIYYSRPPKIVKIPARSLMSPLAFFEKFIGRFLPITSGQLSAFIFDATAKMNPLLERHSEATKSTEEMLLRVIESDKRQLREQTWSKECWIFSKYLIGKEPTQFVITKYLKAHEQAEIFIIEEMLGKFDRFLLNLARRGPFFTRLTDCYASFFYKDAEIRRKLILLIAILEICPPSEEFYEAPESIRPAEIILKLALRGVQFGVFFMLANLLILPARFIFSFKEKPPR